MKWIICCRLCLNCKHSVRKHCILRGTDKTKTLTMYNLNIANADERHTVSVIQCSIPIVGSFYLFMLLNAGLNCTCNIYEHAIILCESCTLEHAHERTHSFELCSFVERGLRVCASKISHRWNVCRVKRITRLSGGAYTKHMTASV